MPAPAKVLPPMTVFGYWTTCNLPREKIKRSYFYTCICECGTIKKVAYTQLVGNRSKSCGCHGPDWHRTHGKGGTKVYYVWYNMIKRCTDSNNSHYKWYGKRGISVCDSWLKFDNFYTDMGEITLDSKGNLKRLDRIDNNKGYSKENCKWSSIIENSRNKSNTKFITYQGETKCLAEWSFLYKINPCAVNMRLKNGWGFLRAFSTPINHTVRPLAPLE
jgi:hypothetical protein